MYEGQLFNTSIVKERFYNVLITNLTVGGLVIEMDCTEVCVCVHVCVCANSYTVMCLFPYMHLLHNDIIR